MDWRDTYRVIEDRLLPGLTLDVYERTVYYHLLRHTRLEDRETGTFAIAPLAQVLRMSDWKVREVVRSLHTKGCIQIQERSPRGHLVRVLLPLEIAALPSNVLPSQNPPLEDIDFFTGRRYVSSLVEREQNRCFYCLHSITTDNCALDHVTAQVNGADHSFMNIVVTCHECNALKRGEEAESFIRSLYRRGILSAPEVEQRLLALLSLKQGTLRPNIGAPANSSLHRTRTRTFIQRESYTFRRAGPRR